MGYYTAYKLTVKSEKELEIIDHLRKTNSNAEFGLSENGECLQTTKWYNHQEDISEFSKLYSDTLFVLKGEGEEPGDIWKKYFKNGKCQFCQAIITFDEYDESKLK